MKMKIAIVCYPTFGGSGVMATELGMSLVDHGHEVHFIAYKKPVRLIDLNKKLHFHKVNVQIIHYLVLFHMNLLYQLNLLM